MKKSNNLALRIAAVSVCSLLLTVSAFAESRHMGRSQGSGRSSAGRSAPSFRGGTSGSRGGHAPSGSYRGPSSSYRSAPSYRGSGNRGRVSPGYRGPSSSYRSAPSYRGPSNRGRVSPGWRGPSSSYRSAPSYRGSGNRGRVSPGWRGRSGSYRGPGSPGRSAPAWRGGSYGDHRGYGGGNRGGSYRSPGYYNSGRRFFGRGRIDRIVPFRGGYRIFLGGWGYPFFVPYRFWDPFRFRIGLSIGLNAFYDPLGYYNVYGYPPYYDPGIYVSPDAPYSEPDQYNDSYDQSEEVVRGTVQSIDLHTGYVVLYDEGSQRTVSALLPPRDNRVDDIRVGDYVEFSGVWNGSDQFDAHVMDRFDPRR